ncbi:MULTISPECIES: penicillin acylase family protein [Mesorhizobium]|jgi:penicillin amidase|uniref:penicillin acylase family protein n=2 Tax=Phyllobacteriaceae TaxID=69277 RepID=UPI0007A93BB1|nr:MULTISPECIES: penicillin acylase family protein [Mesorhizobium]RUU24746.1 penicillin acylase family protein [Mesorhizobium sp. M7A.T.Ca.TU.009.01.3.2]RUV14716.1 penicillin acylase family protein [Mesorhizobium sp. M7A.T.Ca.TU.009.01.3.1]RUZ92752.1 penicillin acylase family protein [Mesorhizobium sp. M7A.F.Ca.US.003.02.2.1]RVA58813.1 penicillin acylase family protein [Mesorhizobium sp. M7A.F.Ca.US.001.01.1.1]WIE92742.1 penicillin acylase family protein [Mesorhizobium sp. WSM4875]
MLKNITFDRHSSDKLKSEVTIDIDKWGVPHIKAQNLHDLFFAQGWNAARDRLWQIDIARKRGLGLLSRDFGPGYLEQDRAARLFLFRGAMSAEWQAYGPDSEEICSAFAEGINSYVDSCHDGLIALPPEFGLLGHTPDYWKPEDVVRVRTHSLTRNAISELLRCRVMALAGVERGTRLDRLRQELSPPIAPRPAEGLDLAFMTDRVLQDFRLAICPVSFSRERLAASLQEADRWTRVTPSDEIMQTVFQEGSNNWAISATKTTTERPILALDPHRKHVLPSIRYLVHLSMPGLDVIGAGEPMIPGISMGHNGTAAFGLTIFGADQEDIYVYETKSEGNKYLYKGAWEQVKTIHEKIPVRAHTDQEVKLQFTRHGPILNQNAEKDRAFALRTVWMDPGMAPYMASLAVMRSKTFSEYTSSLANWGCPSVNHIYADTSNVIAWKPSGAAPVRRNWDGLLPVPGDGRFEWEGYLSPDDGPFEMNPAKGFVATANAMNVPEEWSRSHPAFGYEWSDSSRHDTLHTTLSRSEKISLRDCMSLQCSVYSPIAVRILAKLDTLLGSVANMPALHLFSNWDRHLDASSPAAAFFEIWLSKHLGPTVARLESADDEVLALLVPLQPSAIASWLEQAEPSEKLKHSIMESLTSAWSECICRFGDDSASWAWGSIHKLDLRHPLQALTSEQWSLGAIALGGSSSTLNFSSYRSGQFSVSEGPSVRIIMDVGSWDDSLFINNPGQSGVPISSHYRDLNHDWQRGEYKPLLYSEESIRRELEHRVVLSPADC